MLSKRPALLSARPVEITDIPSETQVQVSRCIVITNLLSRQSASVGLLFRDSGIVKFPKMHMPEYENRPETHERTSALIVCYHVQSVLMIISQEIAALGVQTVVFADSLTIGL